MQYLSLEVRPEFGAHIRGEIESKPERSLGDTQAHGIQPVRIPLVREKGGAVSTTQTPSRECLATGVRSRQYGAAERMTGSAPESRAARAVIPRVLVNRRIQAERENAIDRGVADRGSDALSVGSSALSPFLRGVNRLEDADGRLLDAKDLHVRESALTGESLPVDKAADDLPVGQHSIADACNSVFLGTAVQTGIGTAVIVRTGKDTAFGEIAQRLAMRPPETEFGRGIRHFGLMITRVIMLLVLFVLLVNIVLHRPLLESFLFSVALAVGMTPEMMPTIITITLAQGARRMARKKVLGQATFGDRGLRQRGNPLQRQDGNPN